MDIGNCRSTPSCVLCAVEKKKPKHRNMDHYNNNNNNKTLKIHKN